MPQILDIRIGWNILLAPNSCRLWTNLNSKWFQKIIILLLQKKLCFWTSGTLQQQQQNPGCYFHRAFTSSPSQDFLRTSSRRSEGLQIHRALFCIWLQLLPGLQRSIFLSPFFCTFQFLPSFLVFLQNMRKTLPTYFALLFRSSLRQELKVTKNAPVTISQPEVRDPRLSWEHVTVMNHS